MTKMLCVVLNGKIVNVGPWDVCRTVMEERVFEMPGESEGEILHTVEHVSVEVPLPLPEGAVVGEFDVVETADGRLVLASDYEALRAAAYPPPGDQLDALWKAITAAGVDLPPQAASVLAQINAVKQDYPKQGPEAADVA